MKKLFVIFASLCFCNIFAQEDLMKYARMYEGCVDDEPSEIYGGSYGDYPKYPRVFEDAQFPGGEVGLIQYIHKNTELQKVYSGEKDIDGVPLLVTGEVLVEFVVDRCGQAKNLRIIQSLTEEHDAEAMRVMEGLPIFKSASLDGYRVKSAYIAHIRFSRNRWVEKQDPLYFYDDVYDSNFDSNYLDGNDSNQDPYYYDNYDYDKNNNTNNSSDDDYYWW